MTPSKRRVRLPAACAALLAGAAALPAHALVFLPPPVVPAGATYHFGTPTSVGLPLTTADLPTVAAPGTYASGSGTATLAVTPSATVTLDLSGPGFTGAGIRYFYAISGGSLGSGGTVAGTLTTSMSVSGTGSYAVGALLTASDLDDFGHGADNAVCASTVSFASCPAGLSAALTGKVLNVNFSQSGEIDLAAVAYVGSGSASAMVDPVITLPNGYSVTLSAGLGNAFPSAVPEPDTCALLVAGLGMVGWTARRRTRA